MKCAASWCVLAGLFWAGCASTGSTCAVAGDVVMAKKSNIEYVWESPKANSYQETRGAVYKLIVQKPDGKTKTCKVNPALYAQAKEGEPLS